MTDREGRCPNCLRYCAEHPLRQSFYCPGCDCWFDGDDATHIVSR